MRLITRFSFLIIFLIISSSSGYSQSIKKTFKYIESNEIDKASDEFQQINIEKIKSGEDLALYKIANCILYTNERYRDYNPYKALEVYRDVIKGEFDKPEVGKYLTKYAMSMQKIQETIYQSIYNEAKKINSEDSYKKALDVCKECFYRDEAIKLKETAAYIKAKNGKSISAYKNFLYSYLNPEYVNEIRGLLEELAFQSAKSNISVSAMDEYINEYGRNENKYIPIAIHLRDSIAFSNLNKSYADYKNFSIKYPNSEYNKIIKEASPDLLYNQALSENNIELLELFITEYPTDERVVNSQIKLESLYFEMLKQSKSLGEFEKFKKKFPKSNFIEEFNRIVEKIVLNSDLHKYNLNGRIKSIETYRSAKSNFNNKALIGKEEFNDLGYLTYLEREGDEFVNSEEYDIVEEFIDTKLFYTLCTQQSVLYSYYYETLTSIGKGFNNSSGYSNSLTFEYYDNGYLEKIQGGQHFAEYKYDENGNILTMDIYHGLQLKKKIKYKWFEGKLISMYAYFGTGERLYYYDYEYNDFSIIAKVKDKDGYLARKITLNLGSANSITSKKYEDFITNNNETKLSDTHGAAYEYFCGLVRISRVRYEKGKPFYCDERIYRDDQCMIIRVENSCTKNEPKLVSEYKYDSNHNWIEKTTYSIVKGDIEVKTKEEIIQRTITYY